MNEQDIPIYKGKMISYTVISIYKNKKGLVAAIPAYIQNYIYAYILKSHLKAVKAILGCGTINIESSAFAYCRKSLLK